ncbi:MAG TPA: class I SAM-dependent methyltransferase [Thermoanaerobaculia bacterium]|nr:class I SAM-dependent methyltransferase [Thermoanaerobaculia bacterium]
MSDVANREAQWSVYPGELKVLAELLWSSPGDFAVEVGCFRGRTTVFLANLCRCLGKTLIAIDPWDDTPAGSGDEIYQIFSAQIAPVRDCVTVIRSRSDDALARLPPAAAGRCGFILIDGDHSDPQPLLDMRNYYPLLCPGGVMAVHDVFSPNWSDVGRAFEEFTVDKDTYYFRYVPGDEEQRRHRNDRLCGLGWVRRP